MMYQADEKRYETMQYNRCGKSGLLLPKVSLGLWHNFGSNGDYDNMKAMALQHLITGSHTLTLPITMVRSREMQRLILGES